jgi:uncharacterized protein (DUF433 family)
MEAGVATEFEADLGRIACDPAVMAGKPVVRGTRIPVERVLEHIEVNGWSDVFAAFPALVEDDVRACVRFARLAVVRGQAAQRKSRRVAA